MESIKPEIFHLVPQYMCCSLTSVPLFNHHWVWSRVGFGEAWRSWTPKPQPFSSEPLTLVSQILNEKKKKHEVFCIPLAQVFWAFFRPNYNPNTNCWRRGPRKRGEEAWDTSIPRPFPCSQQSIRSSLVPLAIHSNNPRLLLPVVR